VLAEDLLLLLTDDATGKLLLPAEQVDIALGVRQFGRGIERWAREN
jgi:hypothetical protein